MQTKGKILGMLWYIKNILAEGRAIKLSKVTRDFELSSLLGTALINKKVLKKNGAMDYQWICSSQITEELAEEVYNEYYHLNKLAR